MQQRHSKDEERCRININDYCSENWTTHFEQVWLLSLVNLPVQSCAE